MTARAAACVFLAALAGIQAQEIVKTPLVAIPVGYFTTVVPANTAVPVSSPLVCDAILENQLFPGDRVRLWDAAAQEYVIVNRTTSGWSAKMNLLPGDALWVENRQESEQIAIFAGYLPLHSPTILDLRSGLNLFGLPYFNPLSLNATPFAKDGAIPGDLQSADQVIESESSRYWWLTSQGLWQGSDLDADDQLQPFRAYWYRHRGMTGFSAAFIRPYALPVALDEILPDLPTLQCASQITLSLKVPAGSMWDIYAMEINATGKLDLVRGWQLVAESLPEKDGLLQWQAPSPVSGVRLYMPARSDIDSDGDGLPDTKEIFGCFTDSAKVDTDGDGLPDGWEIAAKLDPLADDSALDADGDGIANKDEYSRGTNPGDAKSRHTVFYVDAALGDDAWRGIKDARESDAGPLKTINAALRKVRPRDAAALGNPLVARDEVRVATGIYYEDVDILEIDVDLTIVGDVTLAD